MLSPGERADMDAAAEEVGDADEIELEPGSGVAALPLGFVATLTFAQKRPGRDLGAQEEEITDVAMKNRGHLLQDFADVQPYGQKQQCLRCGKNKNSRRKAGEKRRGRTSNIQICYVCSLCSDCCIDGIVAHCPGWANGGPLHQHSLIYGKKNRTCSVYGNSCRREVIWSCGAGCEFSTCSACITQVPPVSFKCVGRCSESDSAANKTKSEFNASAAAKRASQEWEMQPPKMELETVVGTGRLGVAYSDAGVRKRPGEKVHGYPSSTDDGSNGPPILQFELRKELNEHSRAALQRFAQLAGSDADADVATAIELLSKADELSEETRKELTHAVAAGEFGIAAQFRLGATLKAADNDKEKQKKTGEGGAKEELLETCPLCMEDIRADRAVGNLVGCLNGHALHAACAADLVLGGRICPQCRAPLFYPRVAEATDIHSRGIELWDKCALDGRQAQGGRGPVFQVGDIVLVHPDVQRCSALQTLPGAAGWREEMVSSCGAEGVVLEVLPARGPRGLRSVDVCQELKGGVKCTWQWNASLLVLVKAASSDDGQASSAADAGAKQVERLRRELAFVKRARDDVRTLTAKALGIEQKAVPAADAISPVPKMPSLQRELTTGSWKAISALGSSVSPVDIQRARHLLALARQWGDNDIDRAKRHELHSFVCRGDLDTVARAVRHYNTTRRVQHALWKDAAKQTGSYVVAPGVHVDLLVRPRAGASRSGFKLLPRQEFKSKIEVLDVEGNLWLRVGMVTADSDVLPMPEPQGWLKVRPAGPGTPRVVAPTGGCLRCFSCGGDMAPPFIQAAPSGPSCRAAFAPVNGSDLKKGDVVLLAATLDRVIVEKVEKRGSDDEKTDGEQKSEEKKEEESKISKEICLITPNYFQYLAGVYILEPDLKVHNKPVWKKDGEDCYIYTETNGYYSVAESKRYMDKDQGQICTSEQHKGRMPDQMKVPWRWWDSRKWKVDQEIDVTDTKTWKVFCRFDVSDERQGIDGATSDDSDLFLFRHRDLVWPGQRAAEAKSSQGEDLQMYEGALRSRRELRLMLGSEEAAREHWAESPDLDYGETYASCVRGHFMHARCFQGRLFAGRGCPACSEALFVPTVLQERSAGEDACCGSTDAEAAQADAENAVQDAFVVGQEVNGRQADDGAFEGLERPRMCPLCLAGPLYLTACEDLTAHRGQCSQCGRRPYTARQVEEAMAGARMGEVEKVIPKCTNCKPPVPVYINGCWTCGHLFTRWSELLPWEPEAQDQAKASEAFLRAVRLLAEQVRSEAARLVHERASLEEVREGVREDRPVALDALVDLDDEPPDV